MAEPHLHCDFLSMHDARVSTGRADSGKGKIIVAKTTGTLYVVATPIGNRRDLSVRAREVLGAVACIAAEDTRHSAVFLRELGIDTRVVSLHEHNEAERSAELIARLETGEDIALVSDAGTPLISDPGFRMVKAAHAARVRVNAIPGPCAAVAALSVAGLATNRFIFEGFLPQRAAARRERLAVLAAESRTLVFYEAPHRLIATLTAMVNAFGADREACIAREMTKMHETLYRDTLAGLAAAAQLDADMTRGELVIVVAGAVEDGHAADETSETMLRVLLAELPLKQAVDLTVKATGAQRKALYEKALALKGKPDDA
jgi:16S rRNA (cytidine1402-2'-O)-methyltransferase